MSPTSRDVPEQIPKRALVALYHVNCIVQVPLLDAVTPFYSCCCCDVHDCGAQRLHVIACSVTMGVCVAVTKLSTAPLRNHM